MVALKLKSPAKMVNSVLEYYLVGDIAKNWRRISPEELDKHRHFIKDNYIHPPTYWATEGGKVDLEGLAIGRLESDRRTYVPWINSFLPLKRCQILELGTGTGSSTVALAEQGANITGVDINNKAITIASEKCKIFDVSACLVLENAVKYMKESSSTFDAVIFFAVLEHMLPDERHDALINAWNIVKPGGYLIIIEAPNRLWYYDGHTSHMPFFNWLPAELALQYMQFSPRVELVELITPPSQENLLELRRWGLGVSFHEIDASLGKEVRKLAHHSLGEFLRRRSPIRYIGWHLMGDSKYVRFLKHAAPDIWGGWFEPNLNVAIQHP